MLTILDGVSRQLPLPGPESPVGLSMAFRGIKDWLLAFAVCFVCIGCLSADYRPVSGFGFSVESVLESVSVLLSEEVSSSVSVLVLTSSSVSEMA